MIRVPRSPDPPPTSTNHTNQESYKFNSCASLPILPKTAIGHKTKPNASLYARYQGRKAALLGIVEMNVGNIVAGKVGLYFS